QPAPQIPPETPDTAAPYHYPPPPASNSPNCGPPMKNNMLTPVIRPLSRSGVSSWRMTLRNTVLTVSVDPTIARQRNVSQNDRETPNTIVASPWPATDQRMLAPR